MDLGFAFLANAAEVGPDGRFYVLGGGIDGITAASVPALLPAVAVVASVRFSAEECGRSHKLRLTITRPDGSDAGVEPSINLDPTAYPLLPQLGPDLKVAFNLFNFVLPEFGRYSFNFFIGDRRIGDFCLNVAEPPPNAAAGG